MTTIRPEQSPLTLGFLCPHNPHDPRSFSGTAHFAYQALARRSDVSLRVLGGHRTIRPVTRLLRRKQTAVSPDHIDTTGCDVVAGLVATDLLDAVTRQHPTLPVLHVTDATPGFLRDAYGWNVPKTADIAEARVARAAAVTVYSSDIMAARAPADLGVPGLPTATLPFGINLADTPADCPRKPSLNRLNLLFVGLDWVRKGGDIAVAALDCLRAAGYEATLTIVGRCPERHRRHPGIRSAGFLDKNRPKDLARLNLLYRTSHLLLLPSRGDCTPMVVAEAMANGTPVLACDTGGIAAQIGGAGAGRVLPPHAAPQLWADAIAEMTLGPDIYGFYSDAAFERAHLIFNWDVWAKGIVAMARRAALAETVPRIAVAS